MAPAVAAPVIMSGVLQHRRSAIVPLIRCGGVAMFWRVVVTTTCTTGCHSELEAHSRIGGGGGDEEEASPF